MSYMDRLNNNVMKYRTKRKARRLKVGSMEYPIRETHQRNVSVFSWGPRHRQQMDYLKSYINKEQMLDCVGMSDVEAVLLRMLK